MMRATTATTTCILIVTVALLLQPVPAEDGGGSKLGAAASTGPELWTQPATEKVLLTSAAPTSGSPAARIMSLAAQQGECERAFVVVAGPRGQELRNLSLRLPEVPCAGTEWSVYQQGYMWANATKNLLWMPELVNTTGGWYPEPLLSVGPGVQIERVPAGLPQALLVEACVPSMAQAGNYSFDATVSGCYATCTSSSGCADSCDASFVLTLPVHLEVWPIKLVTQQGIQMNLREANLAAALPDSYVPGCYPLTDPRCATNAAWFAFMIKHRMPPSPFPSGDAIAGDASARLRTLLAFAEAGTRQILLEDVSGCPNSHWLGSRCNFTQQLIEQKIAALRPVVGNLTAAGYGDRLAIYGFDEVMTGSPTIHADLYSVFGAVKKAFPRVKTMSAGFGWRSTGTVPPLDAPLDIYVALYYDVCWSDVNTGQAFRGWPNCSNWASTVRAWQSAGKEFWLYWANEPGSGPGANAHSKGGVWMNTFLQWPTIAARLLFWLGPAAIEGGVDGWYYWAINNWATGFARPIHRVNGTLYTNASNVQSTSIGDGVLFYVAEDGTPAPGLRFVNIADGIEDVSLFRQCGTDCADLAKRLVRTGDQWTNDPRLLESTRREVAKRVIKKATLQPSQSLRPAD